MDFQESLSVQFQQAFASILTVLLTAFGVFFVKKLTELKDLVDLWIRSKLDDQQEAMLGNLIHIAVNAAEQAGIKHLIVDEGKAKMAYALAFLQSELTRRNLGHVDLDSIRFRIEGALRQGVHKQSSYMSVSEINIPVSELADPGAVKNPASGYPS